jgi:hypothetical protein
MKLFPALIIVYALILLAGYYVGIEENRLTHCDPTGVWCEVNCDPVDGFTARVEDEPCWLIQSPNSDYKKPAIAFFQKDYRP